MSAVKQFKVYLPEELVRDLKHAAIETEQSLSAFVADAIRAHLAHLVSRGAAERNRNEG